MTPIVRRAQLPDVSDIQAVGLLTWPPTYLPLTSPRYVLSGLATWWSQEAVRATVERDVTFVAEDGEGRVVGTATLGVLDEDQVIWKIYAIPAAQGAGVGTALMRAMLEAADPRRDVLIELVQGNERAWRFYERWGFRLDRHAVGSDGTTTLWLRRPAGLRLGDHVPNGAPARGSEGPDVSGYLNYLRTNRAFSSPAVAAAVDSLLPPTPPARVLDAGTGAGGALPHLARYAGDGIPVTAVDLDERAVEQARAYVQEHGIQDRVQLRREDVLALADEHPAAFDIIWASDFVWPGTFEDPAAIVIRLARALTSGGVLALFTTAYYQSAFLPGEGRLERLVRTASEITWGLPAGGPHHHERIGAWLREAGLADVQLAVHPLVAAPVAAHPEAGTYLRTVVWPEMLHATRTNGAAAGMASDDIAALESLLDPAGSAYVGDDPDAYVMQPAMLWTARRE